jgi:hypothetical protein
LSVRLYAIRPVDRCVPDAAGQHAGLAPRVEVGQQDGDRFADETPPVHGDAVAAQGQPGVLQVEQLVGGQVNSDLVRVLLPATGRPVRGHVRARRNRTQQLRNARKAYPP